MTSIPGYTITEIILENAFVLCRATRDIDKFPCILKLAWLNNSEQVKQLEHEYRLAPSLDPSFTFKPLSIERTSEAVFLIYEDFKGQLLYNLPDWKQFDLKNFLKRALNISNAIATIHNKGIIYKNLKPENIFVNPKTDEIKIIDFGIATIFPSEYYRAFSDPKLIEGTLTYMSPEQTGRMNRTLDYRTDMYSLGVTFYQMLTGKLPFAAKDPLELIYCHLVLTPEAPSAVSSEIPKAVSDIVMKLMSKLPEDRYQSTAGLISDLTTCLDQLEKSRQIEPFKLGKKDVSDKLNISQIVYGRENEIQLLLTAFENVVNTGIPELVLISGYSGIGKTTLARELYKPIVHQRGFFISGKFEQLKRDIPYFTIVEAFRTLITTILTESEENLSIWKKNLIEALGINGKIITDVFPQLELVIGKQPPVAEVSSSESENRFNLVFEKFIRVFTQKEHPLTFFADDLQWADSASLKLIRQIITNPDNRYILVIGAYRNNEVYPSHPLMLTLNEIKKTRVNIKEITLSPLKKIFVEKLLTDTLRSDLKIVKDLAALIYKKTGGNPFFTIQFLLTLHQDKLLRFDHSSGNWMWDTSKISAMEYTDNVAVLMVGKIRKLDHEAQNILRLAACIGNKFNIKTLSVIASKTEDEVENNLEPSLKEGLVFSLDHSIKFLHDRVQQAAYSLIPEEEKKAVHLKIGRLLLNSVTEEEMAKEIFTIATHFNQADLTLLDANEKLRLAELNLLAARRAKASFAYDSAITFADAGMVLLSQQAWRDYHELIFTLNIVKAESEYLKGSFDLANTILDFLLTKTISKIHIAYVFGLKIDIRISIGKMSEAIDISIECLKIFGIELSAHPTNEEVSAKFDKTIKNIGTRSVEDFLTLPLMTDQEIKAAIEILARLYGPSYSTDANLYIVHALMIINLSLKYGNAPASANAYNLFGFILGFRFKKYRQGYAYSKMAIDLIEKHQFLSYKAKAYLTYSLVVFWNERVDKAYEIAKQGFEAGWENGDLFYAGYCGYAAVSYYKLFKGDFLNESLKEIQTRSDFAMKSKLKVVELSLLFNQQFIRKLQDINYNYFELNGEILNEKSFEEEIQKYGHLIESVHYVRKLKAGFIYQEKEAALHSALKLTELLWVNNGTMREFEYYYYYSLTICANYESFSSSEQNYYLSILKQNLELIGQWAENCPENFRDKYTLVHAEFCRITGKTEEAALLYEEAIASSKMNGFINSEALAYELTSIFYRSRNFEFIANSYMKEARDKYFQWGAYGKVQQLESMFPFIKKQKLQISETIGNIAIEQLDLFSIIKASQIISGEIILEKLIKSLMRIVVEQAGAEKATLLLDKEDNLVVMCDTRVINNEISICIFEEIKIPESDLVPLHLIHYVKRTKEKVVIGDASRSNLFRQDNYFITNNVRSVVCLPIIKQGKLLGMLYLENNLFSNAFSIDKISTLELLSSQAAISIENALLYDKAELHKKQFEDMMNNSSAIIFAKRPNGRYLFVNLQYEKTFNVSREKITGMTDYEIFSKEFADRFSKNDHLVLQNGHPITYEERAPQKDGIIHYYLVVKFPLVNIDGKRYAVCGIATDITDKKQADEIILQTNRELIKTTRDLDDFIYTASHDLKAPISNMEGLVGMLKDPEFNEEQEKISILEMMNSSLEQLKKTIAALQKISEVQRDRSENARKTWFKDIIEKVIYSLKDKIEISNATIKTDFSNCESIYFSEKNLTTILNQLIGNAIKFRNPQRAPEIFINTSDLGNNLVLLTVQDNGIGIGPDKTDKIFSMFKKMHGQTQGEGIGLYIIKRIIENTGGTIEVESTEGQGTTFKAYLKNFLENKKQKSTV